MKKWLLITVNCQLPIANCLELFLLRKQFVVLIHEDKYIFVIALHIIPRLDVVSSKFSDREKATLRSSLILRFLQQLGTLRSPL